MKCPFCLKKVQYISTIPDTYKYGTIYKYVCKKCDVNLLFGCKDLFIEWNCTIYYNNNIYHAFTNLVENDVFLYKDNSNTSPTNCSESILSIHMDVHLINPQNINNKFKF